MGIDASRSVNTNRSNKLERRKGFRNILCENLERRELMASNILDLDFRLLSVAPNTGEILSTTRSNNLNESPRELIFRFAGGELLDFLHLLGDFSVPGGGFADHVAGFLELLVHFLE